MDANTLVLGVSSHESGSSNYMYVSSLLIFQKKYDLQKQITNVRRTLKQIR